MENDMAINQLAIAKNFFKNQKNFNINNYITNQIFDAEIRVTSKCNANCMMCGIRRYINEKNQSEDLSKCELLSLIDELSKLKCSFITFSGGEPTLRNDLLDLVNYATNKNMYVSLNTNGYLLTSKYLSELIESGVKSFTFSLDSPISSVHNMIRQLPDSFERICDAIDYINNYNSEFNKKIKIYINCVLLKSNISTIKEFTNFYNSHKFDHLNFVPASINVSWDDWTSDNENLRISSKDIKFIESTITNLNKFIKVDSPFDKSYNEKNINSYFLELPFPCYIHMFHIVVQCNGDIIPCCYANDNYIVGNIRNNTLNQILNNDKYIKFRRERNTNKYYFCNSCLQYKNINTIIEKRMKNGY